MNLEQVYARIWDCLAAAVREEKLPFKVMQAATIGLDGSPNVRTVLLRGVSERENLLTFHTDVRSPKIAELSHDPRIALVGVDSVRNVQIRVFGETRILRDGKARLDAWRCSPDHDLIVYRTRLAPGTPMSHAGDEFDETRDVLDPAEGLKHFCVVEVRPARLDWLDLSTWDRPQRARYVRQGDLWIHSWIAP
ncbi:pyridoxine/pyridoxamine 5'-phosphate oxidase [Trinickia symbiotica]|uniref:Pyridoxamine 5'-phosphate oxidase n=1 Tax=Trinickia symbiotica TaxID=863227 RepID=A0A2N7X4C8_9BURK|nr:pyridoxamine 5'-phosphate oxidase family protein [Trinickia symbiotica]PMS36464.1 pyridoxamine 5'-phosphate oxidase [Trinickia symbiotica]PPK44706.1 pyridoxine/pyridoxamine 5'-phosphate oxidase [Trinickia symbiotica]